MGVKVIPISEDYRRNYDLIFKEAKMAKRGKGKGGKKKGK